MISLLHGDCLELMATLPDASVDLTVTSPPYDNLRTYNGYSFDFEGIAKQLYRVTKDGGVVVWIVSDATVKGSETGTSFRQALYFKDVCGFNLHDTMIWSKGETNFSDSNRYQQSFEYMFVLSKGRPATSNLIADKQNVSFGRLRIGTDRSADGSTRKSYTKPVKQFGNRLNVWTVTPEKGAIRGKHPATFPEPLARDHILSWSNPGDTVLDPFMGSGTTGKAAAQCGRSFIGIEISAEYMNIATERVESSHTHSLPVILMQPIAAPLLQLPAPGTTCNVC